MEIGEAALVSKEKLAAPGSVLLRTTPTLLPMGLFFKATKWLTVAINTGDCVSRLLLGAPRGRKQSPHSRRNSQSLQAVPKSPKPPRTGTPWRKLTKQRKINGGAGTKGKTTSPGVVIVGSAWR